MEVTYELTPEDVWQYNQYYLRYKAPFKSLAISNSSLITKLGAGFLCLMVVASFGISVAALLRHHTTDWTMLLSSVILLVVLLRLLPPTKKRLVKLHAKRPGFFCEHTYNVSPEWLSEKTTVNETKLAWTTLHTIEENDAYLFFFISKNAAHIIPKRAFSSLHEAQAFLDMARRYLDAAKTRTPVAAADSGIWPPAPRPGA